MAKIMTVSAIPLLPESVHHGNGRACVVIITATIREFRSRKGESGVSGNYYDCKGDRLRVGVCSIS